MQKETILKQMRLNFIIGKGQLSNYIEDNKVNDLIINRPDVHPCGVKHQLELRKQ